MYINRDVPLVARNGSVLIVGIGARISGCASQKEMSLEDQVDHGKELVTDAYNGAVEYRVIATKGKGEALDRPELIQIEAELRKGELDLFIFEDLGRLVRGGEAVRLLGIGVDHGTRTIVPNDCIDTAEQNWEQDALQACAEHVGHNAHTSKRLKYKMMNRFLKFGGATARPIYGYIVPSGAKTYDEWILDALATPKILQGARLLKQTRNCAVVADWFNEQGVPTGPYCRNEKWDAKMVRRFFANTLLKGMPSRGGKHTIKRHESGRRVSVTNPTGPRYYECPHLAHLDPAEFDDLDATLNQANSGFARKTANGVDPRHLVPKKRTRFPGQHSRCWYCGECHLWGGNGITENLMCGGSKAWRCWNSIGFNGALAVDRVMNAITAEMYRLDGFDAQFRKLVEQARNSTGGDLSERITRLKEQEVLVAAQKANVRASLAELGPTPLVKEMLKDFEAKERAILQERRELNRIQNRPLDVPESAISLHEMIEEQFRRLAVDSPEFCQLMRQLVPEFHVYLVRLCDGGHLLPRARVKLALDGIIPDAQHVAGLSGLLTRELTLDLFNPPQRERIREEAARLAAQGFGPKKIAELIPERPTATAVHNALALHRKMQELGISDPYLKLLEPPADYPKLRRHENPRYRFTRAVGYEPPII